jgi:hypothetical protein
MRIPEIWLVASTKALMITTEFEFKKENNNWEMRLF